MQKLGAVGRSCWLVNNSFNKALKECLGEENWRKVQQVKVGIAGAGGLGSNCAQHLVRCGFKQLVLADFDRVDYSNLNRQFFFQEQVNLLKVNALKSNLQQINPAAQIEAVPEKLTKNNMMKVFDRCQVVIEALDNAQCKRELVEVFINTGKLLVTASGIAGWGKSDDIRVRRVRDNFYIIGDMVSEVGKNCPPVSPRVNIAAAKQADVVLSWVLDGGSIE